MSIVPSLQRKQKANDYFEARLRIKVRRGARWCLGSGFIFLGSKNTKTCIT